MSIRRPRRLQVECLEGRITPAVSVRFYSGLLMIQGDNAANNLKVTETAPSTFKVENNLKSVGTFKFSNLFITMGNRNDNVELRVATALTGRLQVSLGNGADKFLALGTAAGARIGGDVYVNAGLSAIPPGGNVFPFLYDQEMNFQSINVGGSVTAIGSVGSGTELLNFQQGRIGRNITAVNIFQTSLGLFSDAGQAVSVGGDVSVTNVQKNTDSRSNSPPRVGGNGLNFYAGSVVNGNVNYTGGNGIDRVFLPQDFDNVAAVTVGGNVNVNVGGGTSNTLSLGTGNNTLDTGGVSVGAALIGGNVTYTGGAGIDRLFCDSGTEVGGNLYASLGEGDNQVFGDSTLTNFGPFNAVGPGTVNGNVTIILGNGNNFIGSFGVVNALPFSVGGNLTFMVGNGDNTGGDAFAPGAITFFNTALTVGGTATYRAGTGTNNLDITNETISNLRLIFSGGPTDVQFNQASGVFNGNVFIDFGTGFGPKSLGGTAAFGGDVVILNY
ncbi:MAG: hypothetical protein U0797_24010 [Gemmataceae bacterium]